MNEYLWLCPFFLGLNSKKFPTSNRFTAMICVFQSYNVNSQVNCNGHVCSHTFAYKSDCRCVAAACGLRKGAPSKDKNGYGATFYTTRKSRWSQDMRSTVEIAHLGAIGYKSCTLHWLNIFASFAFICIVCIHLHHLQASCCHDTHSKTAAKAAKVFKSAWENLNQRIL